MSYESSRSDHSVGPEAPLPDRLAAERFRCATCGYDLFGATTLVCPECGARITSDSIVEAASGRARPTVAWWFGGFGLLGGVFLAPLLAASSPLWLGAESAVTDALYVLLLVAAVAELALALLWIQRRSVGRLRPWAQWSLAAAAWWPQVTLALILSSVF